MSPSLTPALTPAASESNLGAAGTGGARAESVSAPPSVLSSPASKVYYCYCYCYYYYYYYCYCYCYYYYCGRAERVSAPPSVHSSPAIKVLEAYVDVCTCVRMRIACMHA